MHVGKATGCYAGIIHQQMCRTRGESQGMYITYASEKFELGRTHSGFETQRRHHQKSKTGVSVAPQMTCVQQNFFKKKKKKFHLASVVTMTSMQNIKPCSHVTSDFAFASNATNWLCGNKGLYLYLTFAQIKQKSKRRRYVRMYLNSRQISVRLTIDTKLNLGVNR